MNLQLKKPDKKMILALGVAILAVVFLLSYFSRIYISKQNLPVVKIAVAEKREFIAEINASGVLQCTRQQDFYAVSDSTVKEIRKNEGTSVTIGEAILLLDNSNVLRELGKAENTFAILQNEYLQAVSNKVSFMNKRDEAREKIKWLEQLYNLQQATLKDVEAARAELSDLENQISEINLNTLESEVNKGKLTVQEARENLSNTVISSPFEGTVLRMAVKSGEPVNKDKLLFSVGKTDALEVVVYVNEFDAIKIKEEQPVQIFSEALAGKAYQGHVAQIAPLAEVAETAAGLESKVKLTIALDEITAELKPGFTVNVSILLDKKPAALLVPKEAVLELNGESFIFVYSEEGVAKKRIVKAGLSTKEFQEITTGIQNGEMVILNPPEGFQDNMKVKVHSDSKS